MALPRFVPRQWCWHLLRDSQTTHDNDCLDFFIFNYRPKVSADQAGDMGIVFLANLAPVNSSHSHPEWTNDWPRTFKACLNSQVQRPGELWTVADIL